MAPLKTADGAPACPAERDSKSVPEGVSAIGGNVLAPKPIKTADPSFSKEGVEFAHKVMKDQHVKTFEAQSTVRFIVDANGIPHSICVLKEAGHGLDRNAVEAVAQWRFKPATRDDQPVPVRLTTEIIFKLY